jgi:hypothetical protein
MDPTIESISVRRCRARSCAIDERFSRVSSRSLESGGIGSKAASTWPRATPTIAPSCAAASAIRRSAIDSRMAPFRVPAKADTGFTAALRTSFRQSTVRAV